VSEALPAASGTPVASRAAITTTCLRDRPARRPITLTNSSPSRSKR
jgi:hypothetical protein